MIAKDQVSAGHFNLCKTWCAINAFQVHVYKPLFFLYLHLTLRIYP